MESKRLEGLTLQEIVKAEVYRDRGGAYSEAPDETLCVNDLITTAGRNYLAKRINAGDSVASAMAYMVIGNNTTAPVLGDTLCGSEMLRKALAIASTIAGNNVWTAVCTFGGAADTITSKQIHEAGIFNHASSGQGTMFQRVTFSTVTLADSDLLKITLETNVGSS
jgi:hypothetical protein